MENVHRKATAPSSTSSVVTSDSNTPQDCGCQLYVLICPGLQWPHPPLLFGASVSYTVCLPNTRLCSENIYPAFRREMMQNSEVCFPLARGMPRSFPEPSLCGA
ncbi:unnamed protein product [Rangifer tarandus platyrhynchus]|uniref:Uncharacterized protein n=2 Tax=Rangifer tarandus platyrhynchus TaxID=3082113 RepID=A0AC59ZM06_RANTA|nr:unnamed protein product [Rangifer tarandus platyrhynchus]